MDKKQLTLMTLAIVVMSLVVSLVAVSADSLIEATLSAEGGALTVGDPVQLTLAVTHPADHYVILPELGPNWGDFFVRFQSPATTGSNGDGTQTTTQVIDVRLFAPGTFNTPPLAITVSDSAGQLSQVIAPPIELNISSVLVEGETELRDIRPQVELPLAQLWPWTVGGLVVAIALGGAAFLLWRRRRVRLALAVVDNRPPHQVALDELARIAELRLPESGRFKAHYTLVSDCARTYMERTAHIPVLERTTSEVQASLKHADVRPDVARQFIAFLDESDLVKFSEFRPDVVSAYRLLTQARQLVEETKPAVDTLADVGGPGGGDVPAGPDLVTQRTHQKSEVTP